jgi:hypothetical protein
VLFLRRGAGIFDEPKFSRTAPLNAEEASLYPARGCPFRAGRTRRRRTCRDWGEQEREKGSDFFSTIFMLTEVIDDHVKDKEDAVFP